MNIKKEELLHIAKLAHLKLEDNEIDKYLLNLQDILNYADVVNNANTEGLKGIFIILFSMSIISTESVKDLSLTL